MSPSERSYRLYLEDMLLSIDRIFEYTHSLAFIQFKQDYKTVDAVIRNLEILGEASKKIPQNIKQKHNHLPWAEMYTLRNKISHEYFGIDYEIIWDIIQNYLPENRVQLAKIIDESVF